MLSKPLMKKTIKDNAKLWAIITGVLMLFLIMMLFAASSFTGRMSDNPNFQGSPTTSILENYYTMFAVLLPMIYIVITANKLIAAQVDRGSLAYVMANPVKRNQVSITQGLFLALSVVAMFALICLTGLAMIGITGLEVEIGSYLLLNLGTLLLLLATSGISFLASCIFNLSNKSLAVGAGIPIAFFLFNSLATLFSGLADFMKLFKYISLNTLLNTADIMALSTNMIWQFLILAAVFVACYGAGIWYFKKKDLPL